MKKINYNFSNEDVETIIFCLKIIPFVKFDDVNPVQQSINLSLCYSALEKLSARDLEAITPNEVRIMMISIDVAQLIISNQLPYEILEGADTDLTPYIFSVNKLINGFCSQLT